MILADLIWMVPVVLIIAGVAAVALWSRTGRGLVAAGERFLKHSRHSEAEAQFRQALNKLGGKPSEQTMRACFGLAEVLRRNGSRNWFTVGNEACIAESAATLTTALAVATQLGRKDSMAEANAGIGHLYVMSEKHQDALPYLRAAAAHYETIVTAEDSPVRSECRRVLGELGASLYELKQFEDARACLARYIGLCAPECPCEDVVFADAAQAPSLCYVWTLVNLGRLDEANELMGRFTGSLRQLEADMLKDNPTAVEGQPDPVVMFRVKEVEELLVLHGRVLLLQKKRDQALALFREAIERRTLQGPFSADYEEIVNAALQNYVVGDAEPVELTRLVISHKEAVSKKDIRVLPDLQKLAIGLGAQKKYAEAERVLVQACELERMYRKDAIPTAQPLLVTMLLKQNKIKQARRLSEQ